MYSAKALWPIGLTWLATARTHPNICSAAGHLATAARECPVKLILRDLKPPKVDGLTVLRAIKNGLHTKVIPVVILTSSGEEKDVMNCYDLGANSYVQKPVDFDHFREIVKQLCLYWLLVNQPPAVAAFSAKQRRRTP